MSKSCPRRANNDYNNQPTVFVTYEWTNNTDKNNSFAVLASPKVFQNGQELETAIYMDSRKATIPAPTCPNCSQATGTVTLGYVLKDDSEITVDVTNLFDFSDTRQSDAQVHSLRRHHQIFALATLPVAGEIHAALKKS